MHIKCDKNTNAANLSKYSLQKQHHSVKTALTISPELEHCEQPLNAASYQPAQNSSSVNGVEKLCSKFDEDWSIIHGTMFSTDDTGHRTGQENKTIIYKLKVKCEKHK